MNVGEMIARLEDYPDDLQVVRYKIHNGRVEGFDVIDADCFLMDEAVVTLGVFGAVHYNPPRHTTDKPIDVLVIAR